MQVIVVGGGPAGMMAAGQAAKAGAGVLLLEKNLRLGKKLALTGNGRGNLTNSSSLSEFIAQYPGNGAFLYGVLSRFGNKDLRHFFHAWGVPTVVEKDGRVFPRTQRARDLVAALQKFLETYGVQVQYGCKVTAILQEGGRATGVKANGKSYPADAVVLATGGASYPATGSTGDGYRLAQAVGHTITPILPALVPLVTAENWVKKLAGLSLKNVAVKLTVEGKPAVEAAGEMLFTHDGVSGPVILTISRYAAQALAKNRKVQVQVNLMPAVTAERLDELLLREFVQNSRKILKNSLPAFLPQSLVEPVLNLCGVSPVLPVNQLGKEQRRLLAKTMQGLTLTVKAVRPLKEAMVTAGGVATKEINPATMESKILPGLYFAGEIIDVDGNTGGYNLQAAFSTGYVAGISAAGG